MCSRTESRQKCLRMSYSSQKYIEAGISELKYAQQKSANQKSGRAVISDNLLIFSITSGHFRYPIET